MIGTYSFPAMIIIKAIAVSNSACSELSSSSS